MKTVTVNVTIEVAAVLFGTQFSAIDLEDTERK